MIYIFVALYPEAKPIIQRLGLKRQRAEIGFDIYSADTPEIRLVITGTGMVAAAAAVGSALAYYHGGRDREDVTLINFGSCAGRDRAGKVYLCNKIIDRISGHTFYPDILYRHDFAESYVVTEPEILREGLDNLQEEGLHGLGVLKEGRDNLLGEGLHDKEGLGDLPGEGLHDMEAAAIYQAGSRFLGPHQMSFIKVISDSGTGGELCAKELTEIMETGTEDFLKFLADCVERNVCEKGQEGKGSLEGSDVSADGEEQIREREFEQLCRELHCSETMRMAVRQCVKYWSLAGVDYQIILRQMREQKELPCRDRREGKKRFGELKKRLL